MVKSSLGRGYSLCYIFSSLGFLDNSSLAIYGPLGSLFCSIHLEIGKSLTLRHRQTVVLKHLSTSSFGAEETVCLVFNDDLNDIAG